MAKAKKCTCGNQPTKPVLPPKNKWVDMGEGRYDNVRYRIVFECYPDDYQSIHDEIEAYGSIITEEKEVVDNG